ncbi:hypothetical protein jhhlp_001120 [Lomentospora prolificans]|uniref:Uncharacterized protein n=1 Tax=Lomentospora prolificans TaxID=41688 RepID=A0A2N3NH77_9PEZI|nr:hypothetical protein jhhlp_001120 [Lomentospora prolificans]
MEVVRGTCCAHTNSFRESRQRKYHPQHQDKCQTGRCSTKIFRDPIAIDNGHGQRQSASGLNFYPSTPEPRLHRTTVYLRDLLPYRIIEPDSRQHRRLHGARMESRDAQFVFKETRLNLEPSSSALIANIRVPAPSSHSRGTFRRHSGNHGKDSDEETAFALKNLSPASSIFKRTSFASPSNFLWRVLDDGTVLSLRAVDVCKQQKAPDSSLILNFNFAIPIQPSCVALAETQDHDALFVYAIDQSNHLYSFSLRPDVFSRRSSLDASISDVCRVHLPSSLASRHPHRLLAVTASTLLVTLHDGGLVRLDKNNNSDCKPALNPLCFGHAQAVANGRVSLVASTNPWIESNYNSQTWAQGLRNLLPIRNNSTIKYGRVNMDYSAAASAQVSFLGSGSPFLFTVCIDHRLRVWNPRTGQILHTVDILNAERNPQDIGKWTIDPSQANLVRVIETGPGRGLCVTFSPIGTGEFKFWKVVAKTDSDIIVDDAFSNDHFIPDAPSLSDAWTLADFSITEITDAKFYLWMLWKNNTTYRVQRLRLGLMEMAELWESGSDAVYFDSNLPTAEASGPCDPTDATERWLEVILCPGRFTRSTLETALSIYERGLGKKSEGSPKGPKSLPEAICSVVASTAALERSPSGGMDYEQFRSASEIHWRRFYRLLVELDKRRSEALSLVVDSDTDTAWVVCADFVSAIRECSPLERLYHNLGRPDDDNKDAAILVSTALSFLDVFPDNIIQICNAVLRPELFGDTTKTDLERIQYFSDKAGFWRGVTEEDCTPVVESLGQNFNLVTLELYEQILELLAPDDSANRNIRHPLTDFGRKLVVRTVQENLELQWKVCFSQLILLVHMEFEFEQEEDALHRRVDIGGVFRRLVAILRRLELLRWLSKTEISVPLRMERAGSLSGSPVAPKRSSDELQTITALEGSIGHLLGFEDIKHEPLASSLTQVVASLCSPDSDIELSPAHIQCFLIKRDRADLAAELIPFSDQNPFSTYVQGRVFLALKDYSSSSICFKKAATGLSIEDAGTDRHSVGLLDDTEWNLLYKGMAKYYCHIVSLFEKMRAYSYVVEFSRLALQFSSSGTPTDAQRIRTEMLSRQFNAAVAISHFEVAHSALLSMTDQAMQQSSLRKLIDKMCEACHNIELTSLPFTGLTAAVDDILAQRCRSSGDVIHGVPYHQIHYSWRISRNDYRGAASVLLDRIQKLRAAGEGDKFVGEDILDTPVTRHYLLLINALSCVDPKQAWIFSEESNGTEGLNGGIEGKRKVVTLADVRKQYQDELDRIAAIQNDQFGFEADDAMQIL